MLQQKALLPLPHLTLSSLLSFFSPNLDLNYFFGANLGMLIKEAEVDLPKLDFSSESFDSEVLAAFLFLIR